MSSKRDEKYRARPGDVAPAAKPAPRHAGDDRTTYEHPAFAALQASRVSGWRRLHGSDFVHGHYVVVRIAPASVDRSLSMDWHHASSQNYIEVALSEAQWATFVSTLNMGSGTPCTLTQRDGKLVPGVAPYAHTRAEQFTAEAEVKLVKVITELQALRAAIEAEAVTLSRKRREAMLEHVDMALRQLDSSLPFVASQFAEHMENVTEAAKVEVNAYATAMVARAGLQALGAPVPLALDERTERPAMPERFHPEDKDEAL